MKIKYKFILATFLIQFFSISYAVAIPNIYVIKVQVETTSLWTSIEVKGIESVTSNYSITEGGTKIDVDVEGLEVYHLSKPEGKAYENQKIVLEIDAIVRKDSDTAVFKIRKEKTGRTVYKMTVVDGHSSKEIIQFINDGTRDGDNQKKFRLDLNKLSTPIAFSTAKDRYTGPLFDSHLHLVGSKDHKP